MKKKVKAECPDCGRLIYADELKDHQFHGCYTNIHIASNTDAYMLGWNDAINAVVECAPTVDAEPMVRCKDCRWHENEQPSMVYCPAVVGGWVDNDWFCKGGERRDDETD